MISLDPFMTDPFLHEFVVSSIALGSAILSRLTLSLAQNAVKSTSIMNAK